MHRTPNQKEGCMASVMQMRWKGVTKDQYEQLRALVRWENDHPDGAIFHVAYFDDGDISVVDVWESPEHFQRFMDARLGPGVQQVGVAGQPDITWYEAHAVYNPAAERAGVA
jgi:hypothetical protein